MSVGKYTFFSSPFCNPSVPDDWFIGYGLFDTFVVVVKPWVFARIHRLIGASWSEEQTTNVQWHSPNKEDLDGKLFEKQFSLRWNRTQNLLQSS
jgi:hypothetical protein